MDELQYQVDLLKVMNQKLNREAEKTRSIFETGTEAFLHYSFAEEEISVYGNWRGLFDFEIKDKKDLTEILHLVKPGDVPFLQETLLVEKTGKKRASCEFRMKETNQWIQCEVHVRYDRDQRPVEKIWRFQDISKLKKQNEELVYMAYYDTLTGLYNRNYFVQRLSDWVEKASAENAVISVVFIDIDDFRKINDGVGIMVGDELLQAFGQFLSSFEEEDVVICSHFNSDLYCMAIYEPFGKRSVEFIYKSIRERLKLPFMLTDGQYAITVSAGVSEYPEAARTALELINCAEIIMYKAKRTGKDSIRYFDAPIINEFLQNITIDQKLNKALAEKDFLLYYQPQFDASGRRLRGMEALIRWKDERGRWIKPGDFIPVAEKNGTMVPIGDWVLSQGICMLSKWRKRYGGGFIMSLNISVVQFKQTDFVEKLLTLLERYEAPPESVELEITESVLIEDFQEITAKMAALQEYGVRISVDDFGTGFSSLSYLRFLPVNVLKVDKSFINMVTKDKASRIIVEAIVRMAEKLGYETIAEGVEEKEQLSYLKEIGCSYVQGFLLGKPLTEERMEALLKEQFG